MKTNRLYYFCVIFLLPIVLNADETGYFNQHAIGWHWYQHDVGSEDCPPGGGHAHGEAQKTESPLEKLKSYQQKLDEAKAEAVLNPTSQNVAIYQKMQYEMLQRSTKFANVWMQNLYKNPSLDYTREFPVSHLARQVYIKEERNKIENKIRKLSKEYGLFFFYKNDCPYCDAFSPIVKRFSEQYSWEVLAISEFGEKNELFSRNVKDNGLAETWGVSTYPSLFAVNPKTGHVIPVANGMISIEEMEQRIMAISSENEEKEDL